MQQDWQSLPDVMLGQSGGIDICSVSHKPAKAAEQQAPANASSTSSIAFGSAQHALTASRAGCCVASSLGDSDSESPAAAAMAAAGIIWALASSAEGKQQLATASTIRLLLLAALPPDCRHSLLDADSSSSSSSSSSEICAPCSSDAAAASVACAPVAVQQLLAGHVFAALQLLAECAAGSAALLEQMRLLLAVMNAPSCKARQQSLDLQQHCALLHDIAGDAAGLLVLICNTPEGMHKLCSDKQFVEMLLHCLESSRGSGTFTCVEQCAMLTCWVADDDAGCLLLCNQHFFDEIVRAVQDSERLELDTVSVHYLLTAISLILDRVSRTVGDSIASRLAHMRQLSLQGQGFGHAAEVEAQQIAAQEVVLPKAWRDVEEALVCFAGARVRFVCCRGASAVGVASVHGVGGGRGGKTYAEQQQQLEVALGSVVTSGFIYNFYLDRCYGLIW
jgi:hypothetical protein